MHYLIQTNIYTDPQHKLTIDVLRDMGYSFETIYLDAQAKDFEIESDRNDVFVFGGKHKYENHGKNYAFNISIS
ncbi:MAG: hypothetical protein ACPGSD_01195 [Flavobacteriales bacterium]